MKPIKTIIVDDEPAARNGISVLLEVDEEIKVTAICKNGIEAIQEIGERKPDLVLLDIQMPGIDGFDVLNNLPPETRPFIVFITAYDQYALKAFEFHALDYLLKPFTDDRFYDMIGRVKKLILQNKIASDIKKTESIAEKIRAQRKNQPVEVINDRLTGLVRGDKKLIVKEGGKVHILIASSIRYIEAYDYYIKLHTQDSIILVRLPLKIIEKELPSEDFVRIHRSYIINISWLKRIERSDTGDYLAILNSGEKLKVSNSYKKELRNRLGNR